MILRKGTDDTVKFPKVFLRQKSLLIALPATL